MRYTLLMHYEEVDADLLGSEAVDAGQQAFAAYADVLHRAGVLIAAEVLEPSSVTTTLTAVDGTLTVQDGPFADTKEQLGGTFVIDVADFDVALHWARQAPPVHWGAVEIRPGATHTVDGVWVPNT